MIVDISTNPEGNDPHDRPRTVFIISFEILSGQ